MNTLPAERDLPPRARATARARAVATVQSPARGSRRWLPLAAAAALVLVLAGAGVAASRLDSARTPVAAGPAQPAPASGPAIPATYVRQCDKAVLAGPGHPVAAFRDRDGLLAWMDYGAFTALCAYDGGDRLVEAATADRLSAYHGYAPDSGPPARISLVVARQPGVWVIGSVRRGVTRLSAIWPGVPTATVTVSGPYWVARATLPPDRSLSAKPAILAYDADGHVVR